MLNNYAATHFKNFARDKTKVDANLKSLTKKLSKLTHRSTSTIQNPGVHELYVTKVTNLSQQIENVRRDYLAEYTRIQKTVDEMTAHLFTRCCREHHTFLNNALSDTREIKADLKNFCEMEQSRDEGNGYLSPRQIASKQFPHPPACLSDEL